MLKVPHKNMPAYVDEVRSIPDGLCHGTEGLVLAVLADITLMDLESMDMSTSIAAMTTLPWLTGLVSQRRQAELCFRNCLRPSRITKIALIAANP